MHGNSQLKGCPLYPDWLLRIVIRRELSTHDKAVIYTDPDRLLQKAWDLGDCNNRFVVILIDRDRRVLFFKKTKMTSREVEWTIQRIATYVTRAETMDNGGSQTAVAK